jgi:hypothetical protein
MFQPMLEIWAPSATTIALDEPQVGYVAWAWRAV